MEYLFGLTVLWTLIWLSRKIGKKIAPENYGLFRQVNCSECLASIPQEARKCMHCGSKQSYRPQLEEKQSERPHLEEKKVKSKPSHVVFLILWLFGLFIYPPYGFLVCVLVVIILYIVQRNKNKS